jgi:hypothetical protein
MIRTAARALIAPEVNLDGKLSHDSVTNAQLARVCT